MMPEQDPLADGQRLAAGWRRVLAALPGYLAAALAVALVTAMIGAILSLAPIGNTSMLYLLAVLATAVRFGSGPAILACVFAFLAYNWFFVNPSHTFTVHDPAEWLALGLLLITGVITGQLAASLQRRAEEAQRREREAVALYDLTRLLADELELQAALDRVCQRLAAELGAQSATIELASTAGQAEGLESSSRRSTATTWKLVVLDRRRDVAGVRWLRLLGENRWRRGRGAEFLVPLMVGDRRVGQLALHFDQPDAMPAPHQTRLLAVVGPQLAAAIERARLRREANDAEVLRRTDALRAALLSSVSHDFRTPLATIKASAESLLQTDVAWDEAELREFAATIDREVEYLNRLVENLLDMSRIESGALRVERELHPVDELVRDVVARLGSVLDGRAVTIETSADLEPVPLDYTLIAQVLSNLLENAARYTPAGTPIRVELGRTVEGVKVCVVDAGPGVPPEERDKVFDKFYRVQRRRDGPRGTGLGLAVSKGIVEAHGGRIWVEPAPGGGAAFCFTLPRAERPVELALAEGRQ